MVKVRTEAVGKLRPAITNLRLACRVQRELLSNPSAAQWPNDPHNGFNLGCVARYIERAFAETLRAFLYLHGYWDDLMPDGGREDVLLAKLLAMELREFEEWLDRIEHNGALAVGGWQD
jgi:hypothetical protein